MAEKTNRLITETSPYLLQHAYNPVDWYPWSEEAFAEARKSDKPVLLSIGYAACHWCHVMAHESFENEEIAALMNDLFINIKVDREERPDVDQVYMRFVQMATGSGGWPMTVFLTPDKEPFFGGTYFPPEDRYGRQGFPKILRAISKYYHDDKENLHNVIDQIKDVFSDMDKDTKPDMRLPDREVFNKSVEKLSRYYEKEYGGIGKAPKFPTTEVFRLFLRKYHRDNDKIYLDMMEHTLKNMGKGGIFDQLGGGFARYSVDDEWLVPHFEKMLYDNAQLTSLYLDAYLKTKDTFYLNIAEETLVFVEREMLSESGGFYSSLDADSEGEEGKYYVWSKEHVMEKLGNVNGPVFCEYFDITKKGNFEGKNILRIIHDKNHLQQKFGKTADEIEQILTESKAILLSERSKRVRPGLDDKIIVSWNSLMLSAFAKAYRITGKERYTDITRNNIQFLKDNLKNTDGSLLHTFKDNKAGIGGFLDDYANLIQGLIDAYEAIFETGYLDWAVELTDYVNKKFWDMHNYGYFYTSSDQEKLLTRLKDENDQSLPSASGIMLMNLLRLNAYSGNEKYINIAEQIISKYADEFVNNPYGYSSFLNALDFYLDKPKEIVVAAENKSQLNTILDPVKQTFIPNKIIVYLNGGTNFSFFDPELIKDKKRIGNKPTVYICHNQTCSAPITNVKELFEMLR